MDTNFIFSYFSKNESLLLPNSLALPVPENISTISPPIENVTYPNLPLILGYTQVWRKSFFSEVAIEALNKCKYKCRWSDDKSLYSTAGAALFHGPNFKMDSMLSSSNINPNRLNIFFTRESSGGNPLPSRDIPKDFFNATLTFRRDSTIFKPYYRFDEIDEHEKNDTELVWTENQVEEALKIKTKLVIIANSHCPTNSKREIYIDALNKIMNITKFGKCYNSKKILPDAFKMEMKIHHFYLALENNVCKDYITEKFWRIKQLIVPVVLKRSILRGIVEDKYFIAADDFASPKELAERLIYLSKNHTEYRKYLEWTKKFKKTSGFDEREMCQLCEMISKKEKHSVPNIYEWWENQGECIPNFANTLL